MSHWMVRWYGSLGFHVVLFSRRFFYFLNHRVEILTHHPTRATPSLVWDTFQRKMESKTVLCTGGGGFLGRHVVESLLEEGLNVRIFDVSPNLKLRDVGDVSTVGILWDPFLPSGTCGTSKDEMLTKRCDNERCLGAGRDRRIARCRTSRRSSDVCLRRPS